MSLRSIAAAALNFCVENFLSFVVQQKKKKKTKEQQEEHNKGFLSLCVSVFSLLLSERCFLSLSVSLFFAAFE